MMNVFSGTYSLNEVPRTFSMGLFTDSLIGSSVSRNSDGVSIRNNVEH